MNRKRNSANHGPPSAGTDVDATEMLDLDTTLGLSAFGSEGSDKPGAPGPSRERVRPPLPDGTGHAVPSQPVPLTSSRHVDSAAPTEHMPDAEVSDPPLESTYQTFEPVYPPPWESAAAPLLRSSTAPPPATLTQPALPSHRPWVLPVTAAVVALAVLAGTAWLLRRTSSPPAVTSGELTINSTPAGARVIIGGKDRGPTPLSLTLEAGAYEVELRAGDERHMVPAQVMAGATTAQHVFLRRTAAAPSGTLRIISEPPSAAVAVNGRPRGRTPAQIADLPAGAHEVTVSGTSGTVRQRVQVSPGATTTVMVPLPPAAPPQSTGGWLSITAPTELQVFEGDRLLGTTNVNRLMLPTGTHTLRLSSEAAGVHLTRVVSIERGKTARLQVTVPPGTLSVNAVPWASVSIDGRDVGETPLGGVELSPGTHDVAFTHPTLGQRRQQVTVRSGAATRISVDLRR